MAERMKGERYRKEAGIGTGKMSQPTSWLCHRAISEKNVEGFTVTFDKPASGKASLDWMLVR
jgi:hypothetical protein